MKRLFSSLVLMTACAVPVGAAWAQAAAAQPSAAESAVRQRFEQRFGAVGIDGVSRTPYGLYEIRIGGELVYTDENVSYVFDGSLIDAATKKNITRERKEQLLAVKFDELPLKLAIKQVRGNGKRRIALFEDPNCGYCKQLRRTMQGIDNVTIYTFLYPILSPDSTTKSQAVWCASDRGKAWDDWMLNGKAPKSANCDAPIQEVLALGKKLQVTGTPTIIFGDNTRVGGAIPAESLKQRLEAM
ncbi:putative thiol:disulfide interchange protein DsbC precursor [Pigmentiphaga humi]|uniref:Thiol:disulfide interchange protein n=1 Tax=Pigmentiphaga humi TaxID=2478468 RepID=A0A3P4B5R6_9BURK|nr:DsbC family protein [Pigmentiphaga humi]VCU70980.1 putative thiol:disulfide interchange protein DsbC precursor [Pigmentiphaga humi]